MEPIPVPPPKLLNSLEPFGNNQIIQLFEKLWTKLCFVFVFFTTFVLLFESFIVTLFV